MAASTSLGGWAVDAGIGLGVVVWTLSGLILLPGAAWAWWLRRLEARERAAA